ncbi:hypothetical protein [Natronorubrum sp. FCH18a]|uniref:hypothetical protein n=1 Tax=Natronorubrum sp. FCH18a TaxID=3447018 RepID=UPI003F510150
MSQQHTEEAVFEILRQSCQTENRVSEVQQYDQLIQPLLRALAFEVEHETQISEEPNLWADFVITNLPIQVIGEAKRPEGYEAGKDQLLSYLEAIDFEQSVGIITDGLHWAVYYIQNSDGESVFTSFSDADLTPVVEEIRANDIEELKDLDNRSEIDQFVSVFSQPQFNRLLDEIDLFSEEADIREIAEPFDEDALELLREEANEKITNQMEQRRYYQSAGYRLGRTAVVAISILVSAGAIIVELRPDLGVGSLINFPILAGVFLLVLSAAVGIAGPVYVSSRTEKAPQRMYREYFELAVPDEPTEGVTTRKDVLIELLSQSCEVGKTFRGSIDRLLQVMGIAVILQFIGILFVVIGLFQLL